MDILWTPCCALAMLRAKNNDSPQELRIRIEQMKVEATETCFSPKVETRGGQRSIFCIVTMPWETELRANLESLGFKKIAEFPRRNGYPEGYNEMWFLSW